MASRHDIVRIARSWIGTPYRHQASVQGAGADCLGLVRGVWRDALGAEPVTPPPYSPDWDEVEKTEALHRAAARFLRPTLRSEAASGDVLLFRMRHGAAAKHLGILTSAASNGAFVHAYSGHGVVETALSLPWERRIIGVFAFPQIEGNF